MLVQTEQLFLVALRVRVYGSLRCDTSTVRVHGDHVQQTQDHRLQLEQRLAVGKQLRVTANSGPHRLALGRHLQRGGGHVSSVTERALAVPTVEEGRETHSCRASAYSRRAYW